jgi:hypothetical protein
MELNFHEPPPPEPPFEPVQPFGVLPDLYPPPPPPAEVIVVKPEPDIEEFEPFDTIH